MTYPLDYPLWFLRDLMVMVVLSPLVYIVVRYLRGYGVALLGLCYVSWIWPVIPGFSITAVFFFTLGAYFAIRGLNLVAACRRIRLFSYVLVVSLLILTVWFDGLYTFVGNLIYPFYVIVGVFAAFNLAADLLERGKVRVYPLLTHSTFFIYALHTVAIPVVSGVLLGPLYDTGYPLAMSVAYLLDPVLKVGVCLVLFLLMRRWMPHILGVLTGNRF